MIYYSILLLIVWNLFVLLLYGIDKRRAKLGKYRIPERTLLLCSFLLGGMGAFAGVFLLRHKSRHTKFVILVPLFLILQIALAFSVFIFVNL